MKLLKADGESKPAATFHESLVWAMVAVFVVGLGATMGLIALMKAYNIDDEMTKVFASVSLLLMALLEIVFVWLLFSGGRRRRHRVESAMIDGRATNELDAPHAATLPATTPSITEEPTRTFDPAYSERNAK